MPKSQFRFDNLESKPRLGVAAYPVAVAVSDLEHRPVASVVRFRMYNNYASFIEHAEIRIFEQQQSLQDVPLEIIAVDEADRGMAAGGKNSRGTGTRTQIPAARLRLRRVISTKRKRGRCGSTAIRRLETS